jgi:hypothetical protein
MKFIVRPESGMIAINMRAEKTVSPMALPDDGPADRFVQHSSSTRSAFDQLLISFRPAALHQVIHR